MKRVAVLIQYLYGGGAERIAGLLSKYLCRYYEVYLFMIDVGNIVYEYGGTIVDVSINGEEQTEQTIKEYKQKYQIDCAISFLGQMNIWNAKTKGDELVVLSERGSIKHMEPYPQGDDVKIRKWYNAADKIVSVSYGIENSLINDFGVERKLLKTIYNFIDKEEIIQKSQEDIPADVMRFKGSSKLLLNVGRLDPAKNLKKLLVQFFILARSGLDIKLLIVGSGPLESELKELTKSSDATDRVMFVPFCDNPFVFHRIADAMVLSSDYEGLPNAIMEAQVLGLPTVAVDCEYGPRELLKKIGEYTQPTKEFEVCDNGILVEKARTDESGQTCYLAEAIRYLLTHDEVRKRIAVNGKQFMTGYTNEFIMQEWMGVIEKTQKNERKMSDDYIADIIKYKKIIVYGAGTYGKAAIKPLLAHKDRLELLCFAVSKADEKKKTVWGLPIYAIDELTDHVGDAVVIVGVSYAFEKEVTTRLEELGFTYRYSAY